MPKLMLCVGVSGSGKSTFAEFKKGLHYLKLARVYLHRIDYLVSDDDGEDSFHKRLLEDLRGEM